MTATAGGLRPVREIEHVWIPMPDGARLAARIWLPDDAVEDPVPAVLEYIPYRKNDATAARDRIRNHQIAARGYAAVRLDLRGSGDSDGLMVDEYLPQELDDACAAIAWLAVRPWCTGAVGMTGISWGGFNALQVAALRPPALRAVISVCSTDDRYADDVHYSGGCVLASDMLPWSATMLARGARPPDPVHVGDGWRDAWLERLEVTPFVESWLSHQRRDDYWRHGSVCEDYRAMDCAVYMVGGWDDAYRDAVLRVLEGYDGPRKGLIGPWGHTYPDEGVPGEAIDFVGESLRFWDHWLKGVANGIMDEPMLRTFIGTTPAGRPTPTERHGGWVAESMWPTPEVSRQRWALGPHVLGDPVPEHRRYELLGVESTGLDAGAFMGGGVAADLPGDQRRDDGLSLCFASEPLDSPITVLGRAGMDLEVAVDRPRALVAVRLCEVTSTGASRLVARGLLNLSHREGHERIVTIEPGHRMLVTVRLSAAGHTFAAGSRLQVAISPSYWPWAWPSPEPVVLSVFTGTSALDLPVRRPRADDGEIPGFVFPRTTTPEAETNGGANERIIIHDVVSGGSEVVASSDSATAFDGLQATERMENTYAIEDGDPLSARVQCRRVATVSRDSWRTRVETTSSMTADATAFHLDNRLEAYEDDVRIFVRTWTRSIPRDNV